MLDLPVHVIAEMVDQLLEIRAFTPLSSSSGYHRAVFGGLWW